uniref:Uncharacterized protein n=1 Tax=Romanomermis culicivorax TaxID=13658 RepID=A0A915IVI5_ROMCU
MSGSSTAKANHGSISGPTRDLVAILIVLSQACVSKASSRPTWLIRIPSDLTLHPSKIVLKI